MRHGGQRWAVWLIIVAACTGLVVQRSSAAFAAIPTPPSTDGPLSVDVSEPLFAGVTLMPGTPSSRCARVSVGDAPGVVDVRMLTATTETGLAPWMDVVIELGEHPGTADCRGLVGVRRIFAGTLADLAASDTYAAGVKGWLAAPGDAATYRLTVTLRPGAPAGATTAADFRWEARLP